MSERRTDLTLISLGAGVQSSALIFLALNGDLPDDYDQPDIAVFADTGNEPQEVYDWLHDVLMPATGNDLPIWVVENGDLGEDYVAGKGKAMVPLFSGDGKSMFQRRCTYNYKIKPVTQAIRAYFDGVRPRFKKVDQLLGISTDEVVRAKDAKQNYMTNRFPLIDLDMDRDAARAYVSAQGYGEPPRSACVFCPYHSNSEWRRLRDESPDDWNKAIEWDERMRDVASIPAYVHRSGLPLVEADLGSPDTDNKSEECEGVCFF